MLFTCWRQEPRPRCQRKGTSARPREEAAHAAPHSGSHAVRIFNTVDPFYPRSRPPGGTLGLCGAWRGVDGGACESRGRGLAVGGAGVDVVHPLAGCETSLPRGRFPHQESHFPGWKPEVRFPASLAAGPSHVTPAHQSEASREPLLRKREGGAGGTGEGSGAGGEPGLGGEGWREKVQLSGPAAAAGSG